jgi:hypothetical protein
MDIRNHAPTVILRTLWKKSGHKRCEPVPAFNRSCTHPQGVGTTSIFLFEL